ncbi:MAG: aldehyde dehydrogenase family protein [Planctomycetota bacterium]
MIRPDEIVSRAVEAARGFRRFDQQQTDAVVRAVHLAALDHRVRLARMAHEETGIGVWQHKVVKNVIAAQLVYEDIKDLRTVGVIAVDNRGGIVEVARPIGPILGFVPVTNPTSTAIFKILISMKTRNPIIISPPMGARRSVTATAELCHEAAVRAGAPSHCIQCLGKLPQEVIDEIMGDSRLALVLVTGTNALVRKAFMSGRPVIGVGPGNVPVYIGKTADVPFAVRSILMSKTLDNGTVCASEQAIVVRDVIADEVIAEFKKQGAYFLSPEEVEKVGAVAYDGERRMMRPTVVGQPVRSIAESAGVTVPPETVVLMAPLEGVGPNYPLSAEILAPILAFYVEAGFDAAIRRCSEITRYGGVGHTAVIYSNNDERIEYFSQVVDAGRILVNMPSTHGALGGMFNTLSPSFTLSCGTAANNTTTDNISVRHLLNIHRIARRRPNPRWVSFDQERYLDETLSASEIDEAYNRNF